MKVRVGNAPLRGPLAATGATALQRNEPAVTKGEAPTHIKLSEEGVLRTCSGLGMHETNCCGASFRSLPV